MPFFRIPRQITDRGAVIISASFHFFNNLLMAAKQQGGVYESVFDKSPDIFPLLKATCQHVQFQVLS